MQTTHKHPGPPGRLGRQLAAFALSLPTLAVATPPIAYGAPQDRPAAVTTVADAEAQVHLLDKMLRKEAGAKGVEKKSGGSIADLIRSIEKVNIQMVPDTIGPLVPLSPETTPTPSSTLAPTPSPRPRRSERQELSDAVQRLHQTLESVSKKDPKAALPDSAAKELQKVLESLAVPAVK